MRLALLTLVLALLTCSTQAQPLMRGLKSSHLSIEYDARDEAAANVIAQAGEDAWPTLESALRLPNTIPPVPVYLVRTQTDFDRLAGQAMKPWVIGVAVPSPRRIVLKTVGLASLKGLTIHELTHIFLDDRSRQLGIDPPRWLHEGLAMVGAGELAEGERDALHEAAVQRRLLTIAELDPAFGDRAATVSLAYAQSYTLVRFLQELQTGSISDLLQNLALTNDLDRAFLRTYGRTRQQLEQQWLQQVQAENLSPGLEWTTELVIFALMALIALLAFRVQGVKRRRIRERLQEEERLRMMSWPGLGPPNDE